MAVSKVKGGYIADVSYKKPDGSYGRKRSPKPFKTQREAKNDEIRLEAIYKTGEYLKNTISFSQVCDEWLDYRYKKVSSTTYKKIVRHANKYFKPFFEKKNIKDIVFKDIANWQSSMIDLDLSNVYINKLAGYLKSVFKFAMASEYITSDPFYFIEPLKETGEPVYTLIDLEGYIKLEKAVDEHSKDYNNKIMYHLIFHLFLFYGLRPGELLALQINDFNARDKEIRIYKSADMKESDGKGNPFTIGPTKTRRTRTIFLTDESTKKIIEYIEHLKNFDTYNDNFYLFQGVRPLPYTTFTDEKNHYFDMAELPRSTFKDFRHSYTSLMYYDTEINDKDLSKSLGHSKTKITLDTYTHQIRNNTVLHIETLQKNLKQ